MSDTVPQVFWMRESLEKDFFAADKSGYEKFLNIANSVASIGVNHFTSPLQVMGQVDFSKAVDLKKTIGTYVKDHAASTASGKLQEKALDTAMNGVLSSMVVAGHGHVPRNKVTDDDIKKGWIELGKQSVLFLISIPTGAAPLAGLLLIFPFLKVLATIDKAKKHAGYQELIDSMMLKYEVIVNRAIIMREERLKKEKSTANHGLDYNDEMHTQQEEKIVFEGVSNGKNISIDALSMAKYRNEVEERLQKKELNGKLIAKLDKLVDLDEKQRTSLKHRLTPPKLTFLEVGKIYSMFQSAFDKHKFATEVGDEALQDAVVSVFVHKSKVANVNLLVAFQGKPETLEEDGVEYSDIAEEGQGAGKVTRDV